jgi:hypothetical protein
MLCYTLLARPVKAKGILRLIPTIRWKGRKGSPFEAAARTARGSDALHRNEGMQAGARLGSTK